MIIRQGDVLIHAVDHIPASVVTIPRDAGRVVLAYGEVTGHAHAIVDDDVEMFVTVGATAAAADRWLRVGSRGATLAHDEHTAVVLPPGDYRITIQREFSPERIRQVVD